MTRYLTLVMLLPLAGCVTVSDRARLDAIPKPESIRMCLEGPFDIEFCPTIPLRWEPIEENLRDRQRERELKRLREKEWQRRQDGGPYSARAIG